MTLRSLRVGVLGLALVLAACANRAKSPSAPQPQLDTRPSKKGDPCKSDVGCAAGLTCMVDPCVVAPCTSGTCN